MTPTEVIEAALVAMKVGDERRFVFRESFAWREDQYPPGDYSLRIIKRGDRTIARLSRVR